MPPKKRPLNKKADSVEETENVEVAEVQPAKIKRTRGNEPEKQDEAAANGKSEETKKAGSKKENELESLKKNVTSKRGAQLPSADFESDKEEIVEPENKKKKVNKEVTKQKPHGKEEKKQSSADILSEVEKKPKKNEKKTKPTKEEKKEPEGDLSDLEESGEPTEKKKRTRKETSQTPNGVEMDGKKPKKIEKKTKQLKGNQEEVEEKKPKKNEKKTKPTGDKDAPEKVVKNKKVISKASAKVTSKKTNENDDAKNQPDKEKKTTGKKAKPEKKEPVKKKTSDAEKKKSNDTETDWEAINFACDKKNAEGQDPNIKITSWNVDGLRAWLKKDGMNIFHYCSPDIICLQETKCNEESLPSVITDLEGYEKFWCSSDKNGYAGVGLLSKQKPINVMYGIGNEEQDTDGRCITVEFEKFYLVTVYVPNAGRKLVTLPKRLDWNKAFKNFIKELDGKKPVIICGDMNVAHNEIDLKNPKSNTKNAGFSQEEREGMTDFLEEGFVDTFRALYPDKEDSYTFWTYMNNSRKKNIGWRLDYFLVSKRIKDKVCDNIHHDQVLGSDHCPLTLFMNV